MPRSPLKNDCGGTSGSLFDLNLPVVREGGEPLPLDPPSYELMQKHALFLLRSGSPENHRSQPNPEPFVLD